MSRTDYKRYLESFMQNNQGTSAGHTFLYIYFTVQCSLFCAVKDRSKSLIHYFTEYLLIVHSTIMANTTLSDFIYELNLCVLLLILFQIIKNIHFESAFKSLKCKNKFNNRIQSITCIRGLTYLITVICILAVDFKHFPRYLAKTETYGYSLMDTGVGLFALISGLVHKDFTKNNWTSVLKSNVKFCVLLVGMGITRYLSLEYLDYQKHVTEYGVHWNFFYTLAVCKLLSSLVLLLSSDTLSLSITVICIHEFLLYCGLEMWVFSDMPRTTFLEDNKEGITSSLGYVALYLFGAHLKKELNNRLCSRFNVLTKLLLYTVVLYFCSYTINQYRPTSRTLANAGYFAYLCAIIVFILSILYFLEVAFITLDNNMGFTPPAILVAINDNGLLFFLVANVSTGIINLLLRTLYMPTYTTFLILNCYMIFTLSVTVYANRKGIIL